MLRCSPCLVLSCSLHRAHLLLHVWDYDWPSADDLMGESSLEPPPPPPLRQTPRPVASFARELCPFPQADKVCVPGQAPEPSHSECSAGRSASLRSTLSSRSFATVTSRSVLSTALCTTHSRGPAALRTAALPPLTHLAVSQGTIAGRIGLVAEADDPVVRAKRRRPTARRNPVH